MNGKARKAIVVIPERVMEKIDRYRDELSRAEFIEFCIQCLMEAGKEGSLGAEIASESGGGDEGTEWVSRREFEEFVKRMKQLQSLFIKFLVDYGLGSLDGAPSEEQKRFRADVARLLESEGG